jgi:hypothetical protein
MLVLRESPGQRGEPLQASAGAAQPRTFRSGKRSAEPPRGGCGVAGISGTGRVQRAGAFLLSPLGGGSRRQGAASVRARCRVDGGPERRLAAQPFAGAVQWRRRISRCTDRSAGGCADRRTFMTARARAFGGWTPRRHRLGGVNNSAAVDDGGVDPRSARPHDPAASAPCRLVRCLRRGLVSLGNCSYARHGRLLGPGRWQCLPRQAAPAVPSGAPVLTPWLDT